MTPPAASSSGDSATFSRPLPMTPLASVKTSGELEALLLDVAQRGLDLFEVADRRLILADVLEQIDVAGFLVLFGEPADRLPVLVDVGVDPLGCLAELVEAVVRFAGGLVDPVEVVRCLIGAPAVFVDDDLQPDVTIADRHDLPPFHLVHIGPVGHELVVRQPLDVPRVQAEEVTECRCVIGDQPSEVGVGMDRSFPASTGRSCSLGRASNSVASKSSSSYGTETPARRRPSQISVITES
jgi:hypothetical protein